MLVILGMSRESCAAQTEFNYLGTSSNLYFILIISNKLISVFIGL
jgi:hypothetical protein